MHVTLNLNLWIVIYSVAPVKLTLIWYRQWHLTFSFFPPLFRSALFFRVLFLFSCLLFYGILTLLPCDRIHRGNSIVPLFGRNKMERTNAREGDGDTKVTYRSWTHVGGSRVASKTPCHGSAGTGFLKRKPSIGGFANGTPLNTCTSRPSTLTERPRIGPELVCTTSLSIIQQTGWNRFTHVEIITNGIKCDIIIIHSTLICFNFILFSTKNYALSHSHTQNALGS